MSTPPGAPGVFENLDDFFDFCKAFTIIKAVIVYDSLDFI